MKDRNGTVRKVTHNESGARSIALLREFAK